MTKQELLSILKDEEVKQALQETFSGLKVKLTEFSVTHISLKSPEIEQPTTINGETVDNTKSLWKD